MIDFSDIFEATMSGDFERVTSILESGMDPNVCELPGVPSALLSRHSTRLTINTCHYRTDVRFASVARDSF